MAGRARPGGVAGRRRRGAPAAGWAAATGAVAIDTERTTRWSLATDRRSLDRHVAPRVGCAMGAIERIARGLIESDVPLRRADLARAARRLAADEAPLDPSAADAAVDSLVGLGPLEALLADPEITDVLVNGPADVWVGHSSVALRVERALLI